MGYAKVDDRASGGRLFECDTASCRHCQAVIYVVRRQRQGAWCMRCGGPVCFACARSGRCEPFFKQVEVFLRREALAKAAGLQEG